MDLYYYTTAGTMKYILSGGNIFTTNMKYMNDSEEYLNGLKEVRDYLLNIADKQDSLVQAAQRKLSKSLYEKRREGEINSFSISFSAARDLLSQWSMYAKESGVSLKMNLLLLKQREGIGTAGYYGRYGKKNRGIFSEYEACRYQCQKC
ncbi:MAG: hypothetical protein HDR23_10205 [Lachnospiraceae bacterium]|nr:hypothetical protein [Lachnospiraceae bacterium]